jgi:site-specific recombinase XerD
MSLPELFKNYLQDQKASPVTTKNYLVDINHFLDWLAQKTGVKYQIVGKAIFGLFTKETLNEYKADQLTKKIPLSTLNRHLSALRKFGQFGLNEGWLKENPANKISNPNSESSLSAEDQNIKILADFQKQLEKEKASSLTIKNYLSDLRHFLNWLEFS